MYHIVTDDSMPLPEGCTPALHDFLSRCFAREPSFRSTASELLEHPWIVTHVAAVAQRSGGRDGAGRGGRADAMSALLQADAVAAPRDAMAVARGGRPATAAAVSGGGARVPPARPLVRSWLHSLKRGGGGPTAAAASTTTQQQPPPSPSAPAPGASSSSVGASQTRQAASPGAAPFDSRQLAAQPQPQQQLAAAEAPSLGLGPTNAAEFAAIARASLDVAARQFQQQQQQRAPASAGSAAAVAACVPALTTTPCAAAPPTASSRPLSAFMERDDDAEDFRGLTLSPQRLRAGRVPSPRWAVISSSSASSGSRPESRPARDDVVPSGERLVTSGERLEPKPPHTTTSPPPPPPLLQLHRSWRPQRSAARGTHGHSSLELVLGGGGGGDGGGNWGDSVDSDGAGAASPPAKHSAVAAAAAHSGDGAAGLSLDDDPRLALDTDDLFAAAVARAGLSGTDLRARLSQRLATGSCGGGGDHAGASGATAPTSTTTRGGGAQHSHHAETAFLGSSSTGIDQLMLASSFDDGGGSGPPARGGRAYAGWGAPSSRGAGGALTDGGGGSGGLLLTAAAVSPAGSGASSDLAADPFAAFDERDFAVDERAELLHGQQRRVELLAEQLSFEAAARDPASVRAACEELVALFAAAPPVRQHFLRSHGTFYVIDTLQACAGAIGGGDRDGGGEGAELVLALQLTVSWTLRVVNSLAGGDAALLESLALVGMLPAVLMFAAPTFPSPVRRQAAAFAAQLLAGSRATLQVMVACGGVHALVSLLQPSLVPSFSDEQLATILDDGGGSGGGGSTDVTPTHGLVTLGARPHSAPGSPSAPVRARPPSESGGARPPCRGAALPRARALCPLPAQPACCRLGRWSCARQQLPRWTRWLRGRCRSPTRPRTRHLGSLRLRRRLGCPVAL
jgi:hypothetical protein